MTLGIFTYLPDEIGSFESVLEELSEGIDAVYKGALPTFRPIRVIAGVPGNFDSHPLPFQVQCGVGQVRTATIIARAALSKPYVALAHATGHAVAHLQFGNLLEQQYRKPFSEWCQALEQTVEYTYNNSFSEMIAQNRALREFTSLNEYWARCFTQMLASAKHTPKLRGELIGEMARLSRTGLCGFWGRDSSMFLNPATVSLLRTYHNYEK